MMWGEIMSLTVVEVEELFGHLETDDSEKFFKHVADDVRWTVMGTHPLAGVYLSKEDFIQHTFGRLNELLVGGVSLKVTYHPGR